MMNHKLHATYTSLITSGVVMTPPPPASLTPAAATRALMRHTQEHGLLPLLGAWRLHPSHARLLERKMGGAPAGGWAALAGVVAGTPLMEVTDEGFKLTTTLDALDLLDDDQLHLLLVEALTMRMAPPVTAAGIFVLMGLNPIAGLQLARTIHSSLHPSHQRHSPYGVAALMERIETAQLTPLANAFFGLPAVIMELLTTLELGRSYPVDQLAAFMVAVCLHQRSVLWDALTPSQRAHTFLFDPNKMENDSLFERAMDFTVLDLLDGFLVPIGLARRIEGGHICITPAARHLPCFDIFTFADADARATFFISLACDRAAPEHRATLELS